IWNGDGSVQSYSFTDQAHAWGVDDQSITRGAALGDLNGDGWLDLVKRSLDKGNLLYLSRCGSEGWLEVSLHQPGTLNTDALGAKITIPTTGRVQSQTITAGGTGYSSSGPPVAHFGLGAADAVDTLEIRWPDGGVSRLTDLQGRQRVSITR